MLYLFSFGPFSYLMLRPIESRYEPVSAAALHQEVRWIVVLGGGARGGTALTPEDRLEESSLKRVMEGVRLVRLLPATRLILSGGNYRGGPTEASVMSEVALDQGLARERMILETTSRDTRDQALALRDRLGHAPFYLVTSASHMPRAMRMFQRAGAQPLAAPTDFRAVRGPLQIMDIYPRVEAWRIRRMPFTSISGWRGLWREGRSKIGPGRLSKVYMRRSTRKRVIPSARWNKALFGRRAHEGSHLLLFGHGKHKTCLSVPGGTYGPSH